MGSASAQVRSSFAITRSSSAHVRSSFSTTRSSSAQVRSSFSTTRSSSAQMRSSFATTRSPSAHVRCSSAITRASFPQTSPARGRTAAPRCGARGPCHQRGGSAAQPGTAPCIPRCDHPRSARRPPPAPPAGTITPRPRSEPPPAPHRAHSSARGLAASASAGSRSPPRLSRSSPGSHRGRCRVLAAEGVRGVNVRRSAC